MECDLYEASGLTWPMRCLPATAFPRGSAARDRDSAKAWSFFERVEAYDAGVRVRLAGTGWTPNGSSCSSGPWYKFASSSEATLYRRGQILHTQLCPGRDWTSQRNLGIPPTEPLENVYPDVCLNYKPPETNPLYLFLTRNRGMRNATITIPQTYSPSLSASNKSIQTIYSIDNSNNSSQKNSRRPSFSQ